MEGVMITCEMCGTEFEGGRQKRFCAECLRTKKRIADKLYADEHREELNEYANNRFVPNPRKPTVNTVPGKKWCYRCKRYLDFTEFYWTNNSRGQSYSSECRECNREICRAKRARRKAERQGAPPRIYPSSKQCSVCELVKEAKHFHKSVSTPDGLMYTCRECQQIAGKKLRQRNVEKHTDEYYESPDIMSKEKQCRKCAMVLSVLVFFRDRTATDGFSNKCMDCRRVGLAESKALLNGEAWAFKKLLSLYTESTRVTYERWQFIFGEVWNWHCAYCGGVFETIEHIMPISKGGLSTTDNLVPCCGHCNFSKHDRLVEEWCGKSFEFAMHEDGFRYPSKLVVVASSVLTETETETAEAL